MQRLSFALLLPLLLSPFLLCLADDATPNPQLAAADQLYKSGKFAEAADKYQEILKSDPKLLAAQAGLARALLKQQKVDEAFATADRELTAQPNAALLLSVMGDVHFRRGEMPEAEASYQKALKIDPRLAHAYVGLARIYRACSLYRHAYDELQRAHQIAPDDPEVQRLWFRQLPRKERIAAIEAYLAGAHPDSPDETTWLEQYLAYLKATANQPIHACRLVNKVEQTDTKLEAMLHDPRHVAGYGFVVKLNDHNARLLLDTGASGIVIGRKAAEKAGLTRISSLSYGGVGEKGLQSGYVALADHIRVGELEFADCVVAVSDRRSITDEDGLIGADVFSSYLIDIDMPAQKLRLSPLPQRPEGPAAAPKALNTEEESGANPEDKSAEPDAEEKPSSNEVAPKPNSGPAPRLPRDRYIAPEMANWSPIFRFGHMLLIPTRVNESPSMLFLIDTGAAMNMISKQAAARVTRLDFDPNTHVKGLSGSVSDVYRAEKATLIFGHFAQKNLGMVSFDLSGMSRHTGTEVSGTLGFNLLQMMQLKIDYRDGLVDFVYDSKRWGTGQP
jgi:tetratricopeptide (TPR) repeat protein